MSHSKYFPAPGWDVFPYIPTLYPTIMELKSQMMLNPLVYTGLTYINIHPVNLALTWSIFQHTWVIFKIIIYTILVESLVSVKQ